MLDIKLIREKRDFVRTRLATRGAGDEARIDEVLKCDELRRKLMGEVEALKAQRKRVSKEIGALIGQKKIAEAEAKKKETGDLGDQIAQLDKQAAEARNSRSASQPTEPDDQEKAHSGSEEFNARGGGMGEGACERLRGLPSKRQSVPARDPRAHG